MSVSSIQVGAQQSVNDRLKTAGQTAPTAAQSGQDEPSPQASGDDTREKSVYVDLSPVARMLSARADGKAGAASNADIDESDLPKTVKDILKRIRELKEKLQELQQQLRQVQADASLSPEQKQAKAQQLQAQIQSMSAALSSANSALGDALKQQNLSRDQLTQVASLLAG